MEKDRRAHLKALTEADHARLDATASSSKPFESVANYADFLRTLYAGRAAVEAALAEHPRVAAHAVPYAALIAQDLAALDAAPRPPSQSLAFACESEAWGGLYVIAGAAMGARVLVLGARRLGLKIDTGAGFLEHEASFGLPALRSMTAALEVAPGYDAAAAARGASRTFALFEGLFLGVRETADV